MLERNGNNGYYILEKNGNNSIRSTTPEKTDNPIHLQNVEGPKCINMLQRAYLVSSCIYLVKVAASFLSVW